MGYAVKAEYTLKILREPKSFDHVAQEVSVYGLDSCFQ